MADIKAVGLVWVRKLLREKGPEAEAAFYAQLTPEERATMETAFPVSMVPIEALTHILKKAAAILFPGDPNCVRKLLRREARNDLTGIYRVLLHITTIPYVIKQTAALWKTYHKEGHAHVETVPDDNKKLILVVTDYPDMYPDFDEINAGYVEGVMELTGAKNIVVKSDMSDPRAWKWVITWS